MTFSEVKLWNELKNGKMMGYDFDRQRPIGNYIVDFYCKDLKLALEVDGITHLDEKVILKDEMRQDELEMLGVNFLRFDALLIVNKVESVLKEIETWIVGYESKNGVVEFVRRKRNPPLPLPGGDVNTPGFETTLGNQTIRDNDVQMLNVKTLGIFTVDDANA
jgi:very-short-patch-repair endonuclease